MGLLLGGLLASPAQAFSTGITSPNFNASGCNLCHFGGTMPTVTLTGPTTVMPSDTNVYTLQIMNPGGQNSGGLNVSALDGVFATGGPDSANTQALTDLAGRAEITHTSPKAAVSNVTTFSFLWTAPSSPSAVVTLNGWGNAVNLNGTTGGDRAKWPIWWFSLV